jgi:RNA polymerase sigma-70 factor (ECF subfamily)
MKAEVFEPSDESLVETFKATRDSAYFGVLVRRYARRIFGVCRKMLNNDSAAEDATQDIFMEVFTQIDSFHGSAFGAWLRKIARNRCINYLKSPPARREVTVETLEARVSDGDPGMGPGPAERTQRIKKTLDLLSSEQRICLKLVYLEGWTYDEIAQRMGLTIREVKTHVQNGKLRFRHLWQKLEYESPEGKKSQYERPEPSVS